MGASRKPNVDHRGESDRQDHAGERADMAGEPTKLGGRVLVGLMVLTATVWLVSFIQIVRRPAQEELVTTWDSAIWVAIALASAIATFVLGFWKVIRT